MQPRGRTSTRSGAGMQPRGRTGGGARNPAGAQVAGGCWRAQSLTPQAHQLARVSARAGLSSRGSQLARVSARAGMQPRGRTESAFQPVGIQCLKFGNHKQSIFSDQAVVEPDFSAAPLRPLNKHKIPMYCGMIAVIAQRV